ncbi:NAD-dependent epimerase [Acuticoccus sp.]|uniref:NAD-dependent epimerase n=1 Tax=Acuticoccus sp. TaxID=1904378 RepID=UPI003B52A5D4
MNVLVTGAAGFIGYHTVKRLLERGDPVVGYDVVSDYYDVSLKHARLRLLEDVADRSGTPYRFVQGDIADHRAVEGLFNTYVFDRVIHLAAQAGVRHSLIDPRAYCDANLVGFVNILEGCRHARVAHLTYASTSSVYGSNPSMPFREERGADHPLQLYAATKRANELMAHSYSHLFGLPTTGLRFFTVYGPWGRPDMAPFTFARKILAGQPIPVFNQGNHSRDFTYVDDIVEGVIRVSDTAASGDPDFDRERPRPDRSSAPFRIYNIGNGTPVSLLDYIAALEKALGCPAIREYLPMQPGDVTDTFADGTALYEAVGYRPRTSVEDGVARFVEWYVDYYAVDHPAPRLRVGAAMPGTAAG